MLVATTGAAVLAILIARPGGSGGTFVLVHLVVVTVLLGQPSRRALGPGPRHP